MDLIPRNVQRSYLEGPNYRTQALARQMERRGEIQVLWDEIYEVHRQPGRVVVPYVRLVSREAVARARRAVALGWVLIGGLGVLTLLAALWEMRWIVLGALLLWLSVKALRHRPACPGLHCPGCRG